MFKHIDTDHKIKGLTTGQFQKIRLMKLDSLFAEFFSEIGLIILEVLSFHVYVMNSYILKMIQKKSVLLFKTTSRFNQFPWVFFLKFSSLFFKYFTYLLDYYNDLVTVNIYHY